MNLSNSPMLCREADSSKVCPLHKAVYPVTMNGIANPFWKKHPGLVWSNPAADDSMHIRAALVRPRFDRLLDIAIEFGVQRLRDEWAELQSHDNREIDRARAPVERILTHIEKGFARAASRD